MSILSKVSVGVAGLAVLGMGGYVAAFVPSPVTAGIEPLATVVAPDAVTRSIVCSGDVVGYVGDSATITGVSATTTVSTNRDASVDLTGGDVSNGSVITHTGDTLLVTATEFDSVANETMAGYLATECGDALNDQWLVGGSTTTGRDTILTVSNGSDVDARIDLEIWGTTGLIDAPGSRGIVIPPKSQRSYSVAGFAPDEPSPALHVTSNGAAVWATLQTMTVRGLVPGGLDRIGPVAQPSPSVHFPAIRIPTEDSIGAALADPDYADIVAVLRILALGDVDTPITLTLDPHGEGETQVITSTITAGVTVDIPLSELEPGDWAVTITAEQPIVAAARVGYHDPRRGVTDIAWASAAPAQSGVAALFAPTGTTLGLVNPSSDDTTVSVLRGDVVTDVVIPGKGTVSVPVSAGLVTVTSTTDVATAAFISTPSGIATIRGLTAPIDAANVVVING